MSKRLQVILEDREMKEIRSVARRNGMTVAEWVRRVLRAARSQEPEADPRRKLAALRAATRHSFPTADIEELIQQIERGYRQESR